MTRKLCFRNYLYHELDITKKNLDREIGERNTLKGTLMQI